jgi:hypothetical protein
MDTFKYRVEMTPEQFVQSGFGERKMCLVIDVYNMLKTVRSQGKVQRRVEMKDTKWEHPCDQALKEYVVCDHQESRVRDMQFKINATLMTGSLEVKKQQKFDPESGMILAEEMDDRLKNMHDATCRLYKHYKPDMKPVIYSLTSHFEKSEMRASKVSAVGTEEMLTESSPQKPDGQKKDQTSFENMQVEHRDQHRETFGLRTAQTKSDTIAEVNERAEDDSENHF